MKNMKQDITPMEEFIIKMMPAADVPKRTGVLGKVLGKVDAKTAAGFLCAAVANIVGNLPDEQWAEMVTTTFEPCTTEGCTCHLVMAEFIKSLTPIRDLFDKSTAGDEKGLSE